MTKCSMFSLRIANILKWVVHSIKQNNGTKDFASLLIGRWTQSKVSLSNAVENDIKVDNLDRKIPKIIIIILRLEKITLS